MATKSASSRKPAARKATAAKTTAAKGTTAKKPAAKSSTKTKASTDAKAFKPGDKVAWDTSQGETEGTAVKKQTTPTRIKTHTVAASKENPQYIVESAKSGKRAAHKPEELRKKD